MATYILRRYRSAENTSFTPITSVYTTQGDDASWARSVPCAHFQFWYGFLSNEVLLEKHGLLPGNLNWQVSTDLFSDYNKSSFTVFLRLSCIRIIRYPPGNRTVHFNSKQRKLRSSKSIHANLLLQNRSDLRLARRRSNSDKASPVRRLQWPNYRNAHNKDYTIHGDEAEVESSRWR